MQLINPTIGLHTYNYCSLSLLRQDEPLLPDDATPINY